MLPMKEMRAHANGRVLPTANAHCVFFDGNRAASGNAHLRRWIGWAGDMARSCADLELPVVFVSLASRADYVRQEIDDQGRQRTRPNRWHPEDWSEPLGAMIAVPIEGVRSGLGRGSIR